MPDRIKKTSLDQAYSLKTADDNRRLYADWAKTYDTDFIGRNGYVYHLHVVDLFIKMSPKIDKPILDVGCGTGVVGVVLREQGIRIVDGIDISPEMIAQSREKTTEVGEPVYRNLIEGDLTGSVDLADDVYSGLVSVGTFTHGHLGPESLDELWRVAAPDAVCVIGINAKHYELLGFDKKIADDVGNGRITHLDFAEVNIYSGSPDLAHADDMALVVMCRAA